LASKLSQCVEGLLAGALVVLGWVVLGLLVALGVPLAVGVLGVGVPVIGDGDVPPGEELAAVHSLAHSTATQAEKVAAADAVSAVTPDEHF
jgi:hypothetical protein